VALQQLLTELADVAESPFQADHILQLAQKGLAPPEQLALWDRMRHAFEGHAAAYLRKRAELLGQMQRLPEAREAWRLAAEADSRDTGVISHLIDATWALGRYEEAVGIAREQIERGDWDEEEHDKLCFELTDMLWANEDLEGLEEACRDWSARRLLTVWLMQGREEHADRWVMDQLARGSGAALRAAADYALGEGWKYSHSARIPERWWKPLRVAVLREPVEVGRTVLGNSAFESTDAHGQLRLALLERLATSDLPLETMERLFEDFRYDRRPEEKAVWERIAARLERRWNATRDDALGQLLWQAVEDVDRSIAILRKRLAWCHPTHRTSIARELLQELGYLDWSPAVESEMLELAHRNDRARWVCDRLLEMRVEHLMGPPREQERLARDELGRKRREAEDQARRGLVESLGSLRDHPGFELERLGYAAEIGENLEELAERHALQGAGRARGPRARARLAVRQGATASRSRPDGGPRGAAGGLGRPALALDARVPAGGERPARRSDRHDGARRGDRRAHSGGARGLRRLAARGGDGRSVGEHPPARLRDAVRVGAREAPRTHALGHG
jgi:hypothetical protein